MATQAVLPSMAVMLFTTKSRALLMGPLCQVNPPLVDLTKVCPGLLMESEPAAHTTLVFIASISYTISGVENPSGWLTHCAFAVNPARNNPTNGSSFFFISFLLVIISTQNSTPGTPIQV